VGLPRKWPAMTESPLIVALDRPDLDAALELAEQLDPESCRVKVGKELFTACGPQAVRELAERGFEVFLDLKFHDIPNTVAGAVRASAGLGAWMVNVHASGGRAMMEAAAAVRDGMHAELRPLLIAVTVLTSLEDSDLAEIGCADGAREQVLRLARLAQDCGLDGVVCSAQEASMLRAELGDRFVLVTPGIRPANVSPDDQNRVVTPVQALRAGSDYLVVGRPITASADPAAAVAAILSEISDGEGA